jgi:cobalt-zinc-cadmium efflux system outer membrane protein
VQETARVRFASAAGSQQELLRAQIEATRLEALHAQHHAEARARLAQLNALRARPVDAPVETPPTLSPVAETRAAAEIVAWSEANSPELKAARAAAVREERALALAQLDSKPDFTVQGGYMFRGSLPPMWQAGASVALPSKSRARAAVTEAEARLAASKSRVEDVRIRLDAAVEQRLAFIEAAQAIAATYRDGVLAQDDIAVQSALARYGAGQASQTGVLDAAASVLEDRTDYLRVLAAEAMEQARLEEASLEAPMGTDSLLMRGRGASSDGGGMASPPAMPPTRATTTANAGPETR